MKQKEMSRSAARELCVHLIYQYGFTNQPMQNVLEQALMPERFSSYEKEDLLYEAYPSEQQKEYICRVCTGISGHFGELTGLIEQYAKDWKVARISRILVSILCVGIYEIRYIPETPPEAAINEAVSLAKRYDGVDAGAFVNGILGNILRDERK